MKEQALLLPCLLLPNKQGACNKQDNSELNHLSSAQQKH